MIGLDTETAKIRPGVLAPELACVSLYDDSVFPPRKWLTRDRDEVRALVLDSEELIVGSNIRYDFWVLVSAGFFTWPEVWGMYHRVRDTQIRERLYRISRGEFKQFKYSLGEQAQRFLGKTLDKGEDSWRLRYGELVTVPLDEWPERARLYALEDAASSVEVFKELDPGPWPSEISDTKADLILYGLTVRGVAVDRALHRDLTQELGAIEQRALGDLKAMGLARDNPKNKSGYSREEKKIKTLVAEAMGDDVVMTKPSKRFPEGQVSTAKEVLEQIVDFPPLEPLLALTYAQKMRTTYLEAMDGDRIHCNYGSLVESGRTSSWGPKKDSDMFREGMRGCNAQNLPKARRKGWGTGPWVRDLLIPAPGNVFVVVDYDSMEVRLLGQTCLDLFGRSDIAAGFQNEPKWDIHTWTAARRVGREMPVRGSEAWTEAHEDERSLSKIQIYGAMGGMGAETLYKNSVKDELAGKGKRITIQVADLLVRTFRDGSIFREIPAFLEYGSRYERVPKPAGRLGRVRKASTWCSGLNNEFQSPSADVIKAAMWELRALPLVMMVHDELVAEVPREEAEETGRVMVEAMCRSAAVLELCPDVPLTAEYKIMERYGK